MFVLVEGGDLWTPSLVTTAVGLNVVMGVVCGLYAAVNAWWPRGVADRDTLYVRSTRALFVVTQGFCLGHLHLAGSHSSSVSLVLLAQVILMRFFLPHREVWAWILFAWASAVALFALEFAGVVPYAPILSQHDYLRQVYLDGRWVLADSVHYFAVSLPLVWGTGRLRLALEARQDELEERVAERTRELEDKNERLLASIEETRRTTSALLLERDRRMQSERAEVEMRDALDRARGAALLGELAGGIAHELNQPLAGIAANAEAARLLLDRQPPDLAEARQAIVDAAEDERRARAVINAVRALAQDQPIERLPVDLAETVTRVVDLLERTRPASKVTIVVDRPDAPVLALGSEVHLSQVLLNVIRNGAEAAEPGGTVTVTLAITRASAVVRVEDSGSGFSTHALEHAFEPWVTSRPNGMGLGLALCRRILQAHEGSITATNGANGAVVTVTVPAPPLPPSAA